MLRNVYNLVFTFNDTCIRMTMTMIMHKYENIDMLIYIIVVMVLVELVHL